MLSYFLRATFFSDKAFKIQIMQHSGAVFCTVNSQREGAEWESGSLSLWNLHVLPVLLQVLQLSPTAQFNR